MNVQWKEREKGGREGVNGWMMDGWTDRWWMMEDGRRDGWIMDGCMSEWMNSPD